jgi:catechol 2,3-dioxygenase-like lactoylglutathione lyase family enzyme
MPNDPYERGNWHPDWAGRHPTTLERLDHIACVIPDVARALAFFTELLDGELLADKRIALPQPARRTLVGLAGTRVAFIQPDDVKQGPLAEFLEPPTSGIYALVWRVGDTEAAARFFHGKGLSTTREACVSGGFAIDPRDFSSARHEFIRA